MQPFCSQFAFENLTIEELAPLRYNLRYGPPSCCLLCIGKGLCKVVVSTWPGKTVDCTLDEEACNGQAAAKRLGRAHGRGRGTPSSGNGAFC